MARILVTGGTGALGRDVVARLMQTEHTIRLTSRQIKPTESHLEWVQVDFATQTDFTDTVRDVDVILHCMTDARGNTYQTDVVGTQRLLDAARRANVSNFIYISIVGIDRIPYSYYRHKLAVEQIVKATNVPYSIVRVSQFHSFLDMLLGFTKRLSWLPILPLPTRWQFQTIDTREVAAYLMPFMEGKATQRIDNVAGPQVLRLGEIARLWCDAQGLHKPIVPLPLLGAVSNGFAQGYNTLSTHAYGRITWADYVHEKYARTAKTVAPAR